MQFRIVEFSAEHLPRVQGFECGNDDWCKFAERWIKAAPPFKGALRSIKDHGNTVWLYYVDDGDEEFLVGFASLGVVSWSIPPPDGLKREAGFIPMLAVSLLFQGKPDSADGKHYSDRIMEHVIGIARARGYRELCLLAHARNIRAIQFYVKHGFKALGTKDSRGNVKMLKNLD